MKSSLKFLEEIQLNKSSNCHSAFIAVVLQYNNCLHWSVLFSYHIKSSDSCSGIYYLSGAIMAYKCKSKALEIYFNNCRLGHTCVFHGAFVLCLLGTPLLLSPSRGLYREYGWGKWEIWMSWWIGTGKHHPSHPLCSIPLCYSPFAWLLSKVFWNSQNGTMKSGIERIGH